MNSYDKASLDKIVVRMKKIEELLEQLAIMQAEVTVCEPRPHTKLKVVKD